MVVGLEDSPIQHCFFLLEFTPDWELEGVKYQAVISSTLSAICQSRLDPDTEPWPPVSL